MFNLTTILDNFPPKYNPYVMFHLLYDKMMQKAGAISVFNIPWDRQSSGLEQTVQYIIKFSILLLNPILSSTRFTGSAGNINVFFTLDLALGYCQIHMHPNS